MLAIVDDTGKFRLRLWVLRAIIVRSLIRPNPRIFNSANDDIYVKIDAPSHRYYYDLNIVRLQDAGKAFEKIETILRPRAGLRVMLNGEDRLAFYANSAIGTVK